MWKHLMELFLIKSFFSESMTNEEGEEVSTREIKKILEMTINAEDKKNLIPTQNWLKF